MLYLFSQVYEQLVRQPWKTTQTYRTKTYVN